MHAYVEVQKYAQMHEWVREGYRAVCDDPRHGEPLSSPNLMQTWMADGPPREWFHATLDAIEHNVVEHPRASRVFREGSWEQLMAGYPHGGESRASRREASRGDLSRPARHRRCHRGGGDLPG